MKKRNGQVLILVLLVVIVALAVGLSVASRNITNLKTSTQSEHSQRAFAAAEGGIEQVLSQSPPTSQPVHVGGLDANVVVDSRNDYYSPIGEGDVGQVDLNSATGQITIQWALNSNPAESTEPASIEVTEVWGTSPLNYGQTRNAYEGINRYPDEEGFSSGSCGNSSGEFNCSVAINLHSPPPSVLLRIRPFWKGTTVKVSGSNFPPQMYNITSTASTELGVTRKIQVQKSVQSQLPAVFDYVLYSEGDIVK